MMPAALVLALLATAARAFAPNPPNAAPATARAAAAPRQPGARGRERAKRRLEEALARENPAAAAAKTLVREPKNPAPKKAPTPKEAVPISRVEQRRRQGLPPLEPMLKKAPPGPGEDADAGSLLAGARTDMPDRWAKVPDCERPNKWREAMDDEDCKFEKQQKRLEREFINQGPKIKDKNPYRELIPQLKTLDDFIQANGKAHKRDKAVVVKFYSRQCNACLRIAAKYRRLALELRDEIDCYEVESLASRALVDGLNVTKVPSVQIYDPDGVTRLADSTCMPDDFPRVSRKVDVVIQSMKKRRSAHRLVAKSYADELCNKRAESPVAWDESGRPLPDPALCDICPPDEAG